MRLLNARLTLLAFAALGLAACQDVSAPRTADDAAPDGTVLGDGSTDAPMVGNATADAVRTMVDEMNVALAAAGADYRAAYAEYISGPDAGEAGNTVVASDRGNKRLETDFVPFDPRRVPWSGPVTGTTDNITFAIDQTGDAVPPGGGLTAAQTTAEIRQAMATWENVRCSNLPLTENPTGGLDVGVVAFQLSGGVVGSPFIFADVHHAGWRDLNFTGSVLAVTFTFIFIAPGNVPTDIDGNGRADVAFREIYYDPSWIWAIGANVDVETVALHEAGHGLSQDHFGKLMIKNDGSLHAAPRAVMNAGYIGPFSTLVGSDNGGHCANWASWPNN